jgi:hypothetical protein
MEFIQRLVAEVTGIVEWEARLLRARVMRLAWSAAFALLSVALVFVTLVLLFGAVYLQVAAAGGTVTGILATAALALLCALAAGLAARGVSER